MNTDSQSRRFDPNQIEIEQCMEVRTKQEPVFGVVIEFSSIGTDMCSLQHVQNLTARDHTAVTVTPAELIAKRLLTPSSPDLTQNSFSFIFVARDISVSRRRNRYVSLVRRQIGTGDKTSNQL